MRCVPNVPNIPCGSRHIPGSGTGLKTVGTRARLNQNQVCLICGKHSGIHGIQCGRECCVCIAIQAGVPIASIVGTIVVFALIFSIG